MVSSNARHFDTNIIGPLLLIQELLPALEKRHGAPETPIFSKVGFSSEQQKMVAQHQAQSTPLGRRGDPLDVAAVIAAQLECTYVTGSVWCIDGGA